MATVMIGNARISEKGTVTGVKGDQTGREVMEQTWASGGTWDQVIRPKSVAAANKIAKAMKAACANNNIGYSQTGDWSSNRLSLYRLAEANGYKLDKVGLCNCDCSSLNVACIRSAGIDVSPSLWTGNMLAALKETGKFTVYTAASYTKASGKLAAGDILLRKGHTAIVTVGAVTRSTGSSKTKKSITAVAKDVIAGKYGTGTTRRRKLTAAGYDYDKVQARVNELLKK